MALVLAVLLAGLGVACKGAPALKAKAKVSCADARKTALQKLGGEGLRVKSAEIEEEGGRLVYSFDVERKGKRGVDEVQVDAADGSVVSVKHETPRQEAKEKD